MNLLGFIIHLAVISLSGILLYWLDCDVKITNTLQCLIQSWKGTSNDNDTLDTKVNKEKDRFTVRNSSVWCWGTDYFNRICLFKNLYYISDLNEFFFVHGIDSIYYNLPKNQFDPALLDLSSVHDHNAHHFNYIDIDYERAHFILNKTEVYDDLNLILHRFHPDNLMHVFHDDLLPIFHTLEIFGPLLTNFEQLRLIFIDKRSPGTYEYLYEIFSSVKPLYKSSLGQRTFCFSKALLGLSKSTTWYQYGFKIPQGPLPEIHLSIRTIEGFTKLLRTKHNIQTKVKVVEKSAVLLLRKQNRLILNELELVYGLVHQLGLKVKVVSHETHSLAEIISAISTAEVLIGMHGSILILSLFLPPGALLVEMFPYAINPERYTPYKTLANLPGIGLSYVSWRNQDQEKTRTHPNRFPHEGGIVHLSESDQHNIIRSSEVPSHLCCENPAWLFRIYQDTEVDTPQLISLIAGNQEKNKKKELNIYLNPDPTVMPYRVSSIYCKEQKSSDVSGLYVHWVAPVNLDFIKYEKVQYEVWFHNIKNDKFLTFKLSSTFYLFTHEDGIMSLTSYNVWIRCILDGKNVGPFNKETVICNTS